MALSGAGDRIEGDKITFCFGKVHKAVGGSRTVLSLGLNGWAVAIKPLKRAAVAMGTSKEYPRIRCQSARGEGDSARCSDQKVSVGAHRLFEGIIKGDAWCEVIVPSAREG